MGSGLIYLIIVGMWIAYFLPRWVSSHEEISGKSVERFKTTMEVVGSTSSNAKNSIEGLAHKKEQHILMRRIFFLSFVSFLVISTLLSIVGLLAPVIVLIPVSGIILYTVHVRHQIFSEQKELQRQREIQNILTTPTRTNFPGVVTRSQRNFTLDGEYSSHEEWVPLAERMEKLSAELNGIVLLPKGSAQEQSTWEPTQVPIPTYVSAPKALTPRRIIDLTVPGLWSSEQEKMEAEALAAMAPSRDQIFDQELAEQVIEQVPINKAANE